MNEDFDLVERTLVFAPVNAEVFLKEHSLGVEERDGVTTVLTVLAHWDDTEQTRVRAASYPENVSPLKLKDGRVAVTGLWSRKALPAVVNFEGIELGKPEMKELLPAYPVGVIGPELTVN